MRERKVDKRSSRTYAGWDETRALHATERRVVGIALLIVIIIASLDAVEDATGEEKVDAIGYCIGGTMLSTALALMAKRKDTGAKG